MIPLKRLSFIATFTLSSLCFLTAPDSAQAAPPDISSLCEVHSRTYNNTEVLDIKDDQATRSTIDVELGPDELGVDIDVTVNIAHPYVGDLDLTLEKTFGAFPKDTLFLSRRNGNNVRHVDSYNGVVFDNQSSLPVTDVTFVSNETLPPVSPEGPMTQPAQPGTTSYTIDVKDLNSGDEGTLNGWSITLYYCSERVAFSGPTVNYEANSGLAIPDNSEISQIINVAGEVGQICNFDLDLDISHPANGELDISLIAPNGKILVISSNNGANLSNVFSGVHFEDNSLEGFLPVTQYPFVNDEPAGILNPEGRIPILFGGNPNGFWELRVQDQKSGNSGTINSWALHLSLCLPDSDGDGTGDLQDGCPNDGSKTDPGICGCGFSDNDTDSDGVSDCLDECQNDEKKSSPGLCGCGVSDSDSDLDGTPDCTDQCLIDAGKTEPGVCGCGKPDADSDGSGIVDCLFSAEAKNLSSSIVTSLEALVYRKGKKARKELRGKVIGVLEGVESLSSFLTLNASSLFETDVFTLEDAGTLVSKLQKQVKRLGKQTKTRKKFNRGKKKAISTATKLESNL